MPDDKDDEIFDEELFLEIDLDDLDLELDELILEPADEDDHIEKRLQEVERLVTEISTLLSKRPLM